MGGRMDEIINRLKKIKDDIAAEKGVKCVDDVNNVIKLCENIKKFQEAVHMPGQADFTDVQLPESGVTINANECHIYFYKNIYASDKDEKIYNPPASK